MAKALHVKVGTLHSTEFLFFLFFLFASFIEMQTIFCLSKAYLIGFRARKEIKLELVVSINSP